jgi:hypothetical protein
MESLFGQLMYRLRLVVEAAFAAGARTAPA